MIEKVIVTASLLGCLSVGLTTAGCGSDPVEPPIVPRPYTINFNAVVGDQPFECGTPYDDLGDDKQTAAFTDFRMFVHNFAFIDGDGIRHPLVLDEDNIWQARGVALIDFEDGCENGTPQLNSTVSGIAEIGQIRGLEFSIGVPNELNSPATMLEGRGSPLNQSSLFWSWKSGYKFIRLDSDLKVFRFHLGSSDCSDDFVCQHENIATITLDDFDPGAHDVVLDVRRLLDGSILGQNTQGTAPGCMGEPDDPDCEGLFARLGLGKSPIPGAILAADRGTGE
ncbi:MAG: MbnP family copper-binding protein [Myxococcota bacterium]|nr:MbnP family copper-binding protein [Myxococcota bacterium]